MTAEIKIIHEMKKVAKNGNKYTLVLAVIKIGGQEFVRRFAIFE